MIGIVESVMAGKVGSLCHTSSMATKKRQAKKEARKAARKNAAEEGVASAQAVFRKILGKADPDSQKDR